MEADTCVDPDAVMIHLLATTLAHAAVFRSGRLRLVASIAPSHPAEQDVVRCVALHCFLNLRSRRVFVNVAWISITGLVIAPIAGCHKGY